MLLEIRVARFEAFESLDFEKDHSLVKYFEVPTLLKISYRHNSMQERHPESQHRNYKRPFRKKKEFISYYIGVIFI